MTSLTRLSLANRMIVGLATLAIIAFGVLATLNLKQELLPSIQVPTAIVTASYPGVSPQIVADDVSTPLERALSGVSGVTKVQSTSTNGIATITVEWEYGLDADQVVGDIRNAVDGVAPTLPEQVETEVITGSTDDIPVLLLAVASDASLDEAGRQVENVAIPVVRDRRRTQCHHDGGEHHQLRDAAAEGPAQTRRHRAGSHSDRAGTGDRHPAGSSFDENLELAVEVATPLTPSSSSELCRCRPRTVRSRCPRSPRSKWTRSSRPPLLGPTAALRSACCSQGHRRRRGGDSRTRSPP